MMKTTRRRNQGVASSVVRALVPWCLLSVASLGALGASDAIRFEALSGGWAGTEVESQTGECSIGFPHRRHETSPLRLVFDVASDGTFTVSVEVKRMGKVVPDKWLGQFNDDRTITVGQTVHARCSGVERDYTILYSGKVASERGQLEIKMEGTDETCPEMKCEFKRVISAKKE